MNLSTESQQAAAVEGVVVHETHAAVYDQLQHTVLQLVQAALDQARRGAAIDAARPLRTDGTNVVRADSTLSSREHEVLQRIVAGDSNKMIARTLGLSPHTVKRHVANILDKLGARSRAQAAAWLLARH
ncbi:MAG TPA: helix-turn-helix transcriptional regulator [Burkholderiaceae bacterium]|nr:helix-turn-helix transcriptional regulator [Burkholderiaceae bacterium]